MLDRPTPLTTAQEAWLREKEAESAQRVAAMREEAERIIKASRESIQPRLRQVLDECQADYDGEREYGWAHPADLRGTEW